MSQIGKSWAKIDRVKKITNEQFDQLYVSQGSIDSGTYGLVQKAIQIKTGNTVAVKVLRDYSSRDSFKKQQQLMSLIKHPNVLSSLGLYYIAQKSKFILVSPFCVNGNLKNCINMISKKDDEEKIKLCLQISRGLNALHIKNFMHRDIKPANILFDENWTPKICDFGFSKQDSDFQKSVQVGTPSFRDPNIQSGNYSKKCDIYSLGLVFYYIFNGSSPFKETQKRNFDREVRVFQDQSKKKVDLLANCPQPMKQILKGCLQKSQFYRFSSSRLIEQLTKVYSQYTGRSFQSIYDESSIFFTPCDSSVESFSSEIRVIKNQKRFEEEIYNKQTPKMVKIATDQSIPENFEDMRLSQAITPNYYREMSQKKQVSNSEGIARILKAKILVDEQLQKSKNAQKVYSYFTARKMAIKGLDKLCLCQKIRQYELKLIVFICLFGYIHFLKNKTLFFANKIKDGNIEGVSLAEMSERMVDQCTKLIEKETKSAKGAIKTFLNELYADKQMYGHLMTVNLKKMVTNSRQKSLQNIEEINSDDIKKEVQNLLQKNEKQLTKDDLVSFREILLIFE